MKKNLKINEISKTYENKVKALCNVNLEIFEGEIFGLIGPNGSGKSTLLKIIANYVDQDEGIIRYHDKIISNNKEFSKKNISYCSQDPIFYDHLTVKENLRLMIELLDVKMERKKEEFDNLLLDHFLWEKKDKLARTLSGGQKKRLSLMCSLIKRPKILLLDEPFAGLDPQSKEKMINQIDNFRKKNDNDVIIIIASHFIEEISDLSDQMGLINDGRIIAVGDSSDFIERNLQQKYYFEVICQNSISVLDFINTNIKSNENLSFCIEKTMNKKIVFSLISSKDEAINYNNMLLTNIKEISKISFREVPILDLNKN